MTRTMGDAIHANVAALAAAGPWDLVAPYVTGTPDICWTPADLALFRGSLVATIDQGGAGSPVLSATVRDVESLAWPPSSAVDRTGWTAARPTQYCSENTLPALLRLGWQGDLWLAIPGWQPGQPLPAAPGCTVVAVQNQLGARGGTYDSSVVLDPAWPQEATVQIPGVPGTWLVTPMSFTGSDGAAHYVGLGLDGTVWHAVYRGGAWSLAQL